jgi:hypothetical protein
MRIAMAAITRLLLFAAVSLTLAGCGGAPKLDASSDDSLKDSIASAKDSLSPEEREEFEDALKIIAFSDVDNLFELAADPESIQRQLKDKVDGKTPHEIIAEAKAIKADRRAKQREQIVSEIKELQEQQNQTAKAKEQLKAFVVQRSRFYFNEDRFLKKPIIELTVKNNTKHPVARAHFHGVLATPGRSVPWVEDGFNYQISGGLEPGESDTWNLAPNSFGEWGKAPRDRDDMVLTVTVTRIDGPNDETILDAEFSEYDQKRLDELRVKLSEMDTDGT